MIGSNIIMEEIVSIEEIGVRDTIDIKVDGDHLFYVNGILTHNSAYDKKNDPNLAMMGESIKKVEHADFVGLLRSELDERPDGSKSDEGTLVINIAKNRSGPKNRQVSLRTNFSKYSIYDTKRREPSIIQIDEIDLTGDEIL